ncbi:MAG: Xaa-Pro dipeptidase [Gammaproteobacteria bacterium]
MSNANHVTQHYADHVASQQDAWENALAAEGFDSAVIHSGSQLTSFLDDYHYPFRPNPHFLAWVPLTHHDECVIIVRPGQKPVLYYYQPDDYWYLPPADPEAWWADHFEVRPTREASAWRAGVPLGREAYVGDAPDIAAEGDLNPRRLLNRMHLHRTRKTDYEVACLREANRVAARAHREAERAFREGCDEFDIHHRYLGAARQSAAELPYGAIVALNRHCAVLHYQQQERTAPEASRSFLIDAGATFNAYCSDITRTYSAEEGAFHDLIGAMDEAQQVLCGRMRAGEDYRELHLAAHHLIADILARFGLIRVGAEEAVESGLSGVFFPHGLGHFLGLQTHDVAGLIADEDGGEIPRPKGHPFLRLTRVLEPGNVVTVEPGLYFIDSLLERWRARGGTADIAWERVDELRPFGGIRIEDDVLVTEDEPVNLSREAFAGQ